MLMYHAGNSTFTWAEVIIRAIGSIGATKQVVISHYFVNSVFFRSFMSLRGKRKTKDRTTRYMDR